jgi:hypothetical protein
MTDDDGGGVVDGSSIDDYDAVLFVGCVVLCWWPALVLWG